MGTGASLLAPTVTVFQNSVGNQISAVSSMLKAVQDKSAADRQSAVKYQILDTVDAKPVSEEIRAIEGSRQLLPSDSMYDPMRANLDSRIASLNAQIVNSKPIGKRVDGCASKVGRCQARHAEAAEALKSARSCRATRKS